VSLLLSQKVICRALTRMLTARGIRTMPRLSMLHITSVGRLTGATAVSTIRAPTTSELGRLGKIEARNYCGRQLVVLRAPVEANPPVVSLLLCAPDEMAAEELKVAATSAVSAALLSLEKPRVLPGGGCTEVLTAAHLRHRARGLPPRLQQDIEEFAECLEAQAFALVPRTADLVKREFVQLILDAEGLNSTKPRGCTSAGQFCGWVSEEQQVASVLQVSSAGEALHGRVVEPLNLKCRNLKAAFETTAGIIQISSIVRDVS